MEALREELTGKGFEARGPLSWTLWYTADLAGVVRDSVRSYSRQDSNDSNVRPWHITPKALPELGLTSLWYLVADDGAAFREKKA